MLKLYKSPTTCPGFFVVFFVCFFFQELVQTIHKENTIPPYIMSYYDIEPNSVMEPNI